MPGCLDGDEAAEQAGSHPCGMAPLSAAAVHAQGVGMPGFWRDEQGQGLVEYALILAVISIAILVALVFFKDQLSNLFSSIGNNLT